MKVEPQPQAPGQAQTPGVIKPEPHTSGPTGPPADPHATPRVKPEPGSMAPGPAPGPMHPPQVAGEVHVKREPGASGAGATQPPQPFGVLQQQQGMTPGWPQQQQQHPQFQG